MVIAESAMQLSICRNVRYASIALSQNQNEHIAYIHRINKGESIMTREEQIAKRAEEVTSRFCYRHGYSNAKDAFIEGAKWADNN